MFNDISHGISSKEDRGKSSRSNQFLAKYLSKFANGGSYNGASVSILPKLCKELNIKQLLSLHFSCFQKTNEQMKHGHSFFWQSTPLCPLSCSSVWRLFLVWWVTPSHNFVYSRILLTPKYTVQTIEYLNNLFLWILVIY